MDNKQQEEIIEEFEDQGPEPMVDTEDVAPAAPEAMSACARCGKTHAGDCDWADVHAHQNARLKSL